jgi:hypothetical protein
MVTFFWTGLDEVRMKKLGIDKFRLSLLWVLMVTVLVTVSCGTLRTRNPVPKGMIHKAEVPGLSNVRFTSGTRLADEIIGDLYRAYVDSNDSGLDFNYIDIPRDFTQVSEEPFDPKYMKALYDYGFQMAIKGLKWNQLPAYFTPSKK